VRFVTEKEILHRMSRLFLRNVNLAQDVTLTADFQYNENCFFQRVYINNTAFAGL